MMTRISNLFPVLSAIAMGAVLVAAPAHAGVAKIGVLSCHIDGGTGMIVYSKKTLRCTFRRSSGKVERYRGSISKFGLDIGKTTGTSLVWAVLAPGSTRVGALEGSYIGATAEVTAGAGYGANVLVGGFKRSITLQPVSFQSQTGVNLAAGVTGLRLRAVR